MQSWDTEEVNLRNRYSDMLTQLRSPRFNSVDKQIENLEDTLIRWIELGLQLYDIFVIADTIIQSPEEVAASSDPYEKYKNTREFVLNNAVNNMEALQIRKK